MGNKTVGKALHIPVGSKGISGCCEDRLGFGSNRGWLEGCSANGFDAGVFLCFFGATFARFFLAGRGGVISMSISIASIHMPPAR